MTNITSLARLNSGSLTSGHAKNQNPQLVSAKQEASQAIQRLPATIVALSNENAHHASFRNFLAPQGAAITSSATKESAPAQTLASNDLEAPSENGISLITGSLADTKPIIINGVTNIEEDGSITRYTVEGGKIIPVPNNVSSLSYAAPIVATPNSPLLPSATENTALSAPITEKIIPTPLPLADIKPPANRSFPGVTTANIASGDLGSKTKFTLPIASGVPLILQSVNIEA